MDYVNRIPALANDDAVTDVPLYTHELREVLVGDGGYITDTGWVDVTTRAGFSAHSSFRPQVRRVGARVFMRGGWTSTGITSGASQVVADVPAGFRPSAASGSSASAFGVFWTTTTSAMGFVRVYGDGSVELRTAATVGSSLLAMDGLAWFID